MVCGADRMMLAQSLLLLLLLLVVVVVVVVWLGTLQLHCTEAAVQLK